MKVTNWFVFGGGVWALLAALEFFRQGKPLLGGGYLASAVMGFLFSFL